MEDVNTVPENVLKKRKMVEKLAADRVIAVREAKKVRWKLFLRMRHVDDDSKNVTSLVERRCRFVNHLSGLNHARISLFCLATEC